MDGPDTTTTAQEVGREQGKVIPFPGGWLSHDELVPVASDTVDDKLAAAPAGAASFLSEDATATLELWDLGEQAPTPAAGTDDAEATEVSPRRSRMTPSPRVVIRGIAGAAIASSVIVAIATFAHGGGHPSRTAGNLSPLAPAAGALRKTPTAASHQPKVVRTRTSAKRHHHKAKRRHHTASHAVATAKASAPSSMSSTSAPPARATGPSSATSSASLPINSQSSASSHQDSSDGSNAQGCSDFAALC